jgi:hypothetical protein
VNLGSVLDVVTTPGDPGRPPPSDVQVVLERAFRADLSAVRIHADSRAGCLAQALRADAFTCGADIYFAPGAYEPRTTAGMWLLAHEVAHALQQSRGPVEGFTVGGCRLGAPGDLWEREADVCAAMVVAGRRAATPIHPGVAGSHSSTATIQRHVSFEHRLLGDGPTADLVAIATGGPRREDVLRNQIQLLTLWKDDPTAVSEADVKRLCPWIRTVRLGPAKVLATYGELNALPDYLADAAAFDAVDPGVLLPILQVIRQEGYNQLTLLLTNKNPNTTFNRAACAPWSLSMVNNILETAALDTLTLGLGARGENHYQGLLARNACHFAPYSWYRWQASHLIARDLASRAYVTKDPTLAHQAWAFHGYADHFLQDSFAAGHLVNKTLVMQWFIDWAASQSLLPVADWDAIKNMTTAHQGSLGGQWLYDPTYQGTSNDPQTAQEAASFVGRILASSVVADGKTSRVAAYQNYLTFLTSAATQLASANLHDPYNANSLWVSSIVTPTPYEIWGDDTLFTGANGGDGVAQTSGAAQASQQALVDILTAGGSSITTEQIRQRFPTNAGSSATSLQDLGSWNATQAAYCESTSFPAFAATLKTILLRLASPRLGVVSQDQAFASVWSTSLPSSGYHAVNTLSAGGRLFTGSNGYVYELDTRTGAVLHSLLVTSSSGVGDYETRLATDGTTLFVGVHGYVYGVALADWSQPQWNVGVGGTAAYQPVSVACYQSRLFAASNGYVYELNPSSGKQLHSLLVTSRFGTGNYESRMATDGTSLFVGVHGYVYGVSLATWRAAWNVAVGGTAAYQPVSVVCYQSRLFAGSNGYVYELNPASGSVIDSLLVTDSIGAGDYDVRLAVDTMWLFVGVHGYVYGVALNDWNATAWNVGVGGLGAFKRVSVLLDGRKLLAASNGYVYQLNPATGTILHSLGLTYPVGVGDYDTRLATDGRDLYAGVHGYANKVQVNDPKGTDRMLVTAVANNVPSPVKATYTSGGGTLLVQFAGSAYSAKGQSMVSANLTLDGIVVATASVFANSASMHLSLVPVAVLLPGVKPGAHAFTVTAGAQTTLDQNDLFTITVTEFSLS